MHDLQQTLPMEGRSMPEIVNFVIHIILPNVDMYIYYFVKLSFKIVTNNIR